MPDESKNELALKGENATGEFTKLSEDAEGLGPMHVGRVVVGAVDRIVGEGGAEVPGFVVTKNEMLQLVPYWATEIIDLDFTFFLDGCTGSSEWRTRSFANRRLNRIAKFIGEEEVTKEFRRAEQAFGKKVDQRAWNIFMHGTKEEQQRFQDEVQEEMARDRKESEGK